MQRVFLPLNLIFNADFQKINAAIPFTPSYLEPCFLGHNYAIIWQVWQTELNWVCLHSPISVGCLSKGHSMTRPCTGRRDRQWWHTVWPQINRRGTLSPWQQNTSSQTRHSRIVWKDNRNHREQGTWTDNHDKYNIWESESKKNIYITAF